MKASKFAGVLGNNGAAKAYGKKRLMIDHGNHVHASIFSVDSYLRTAQNVHRLCCLTFMPLISMQPATTFRKDTANCSDGLRFRDRRQTICGWCYSTLGVCNVDVIGCYQPQSDNELQSDKADVLCTF